ncbi:Aste57867_17564 [Aphanomyces stellatus]|uniref:Aste57867_17564 protein n=1 Tax=Aphanomyces stellatus TaxID=120398 RepID=A0A485L9Q5_9STRA|nr:hypothetical protein As57867_017504 [Aphanomyces stellatus]VFT94315.1 Aste57867_17564 [Aphanomyces stellatus]
MPGVVPLFRAPDLVLSSLVRPALTWLSSHRTSVSAFFGFGYLLFSLACSIWYVALLDPSLANSLFWASYNASDYQIFLTDLVNLNLQTTRQGSVKMLDATLQYSGQAVQSTFQANYARRVLYSEMLTLSLAIRTIRATSTSHAVSFYAQYCWVDFDKRWELAHTATRATRCLALYQGNAANYMETLVRNTDWTGFLAANSHTWPIAMELALAATREGFQWLADRPSACQQLSVDDEVSFLGTKNVTRYQIQWQNEYQMTLTESIAIVNALGARLDTPLKTMTHAWGPWTSSNLFWNFRNDLVTFASLNMSLVRSASNFYETQGVTVAMLYGLDDLNGNFAQQIGVLYNQIGPFGSVDSFFVVPPSSHGQLYATFMATLDSMLNENATALQTFRKMDGISLTPFPPAFSGPDMAYYGGNLLCLFNPPTPYPQTMIAFDDSCTQQLPFTILASNIALLFALFASGATNAISICSLQGANNDCLQSLHQVQQMLVQFALNNVTPLRALKTQAAIDTPSIQWTQYAQDATGNWLLLQQPLLDSDTNWSFYGWLAIFDWMEGTREVIRLEGDASTIVVISEVCPVFSLPTGTTSQQSGPRMFFSLVVYTSIMCICISLVLAIYAILARFQIAGENLFAFNRVAGVIWVGRPLLVLRGLTAILVLSTSQTQLVSELGYTKFISSPRSVWETMIIAGETTWLTYCANDAFIIFNTGLTKVAAPVASFFTWTTILILETKSPIKLVAVLDRGCDTGTSDFEVLYCQSGQVIVGEWNRIVVLLLINWAWITFSYILAVASKRRGRLITKAPLIIHGTAAAFLYIQELEDDDLWQLDHAACVLSGLLPFWSRGGKYLFDVKLWIVLENRRLSKCPENDEGVTSMRRPKFSSPKLCRVNGWTLTDETCPPESIIIVQHRTLWKRMTLICSFMYILASSAASISYIVVSKVNFANDFFWATFNQTGHHVAIADWFNQQLALNRKMSNVRLDEPRWGTLDTNYTDSNLEIQASPWYGVTLAFGQLSALQFTIQGLRHTDGCLIPWIFTQYCWVDFGRNWQMANSIRRQSRCLADMSNGALYLESVLRNMDWEAFNTCWGQSFDIGFRNELQSSLIGQSWLSTVQGNTNSVDDEIKFWQNSGIMSFVVQWQNFKMPGLINTYKIENALGVQYPMTLSHSNGSFTLGTQTSFKMYWTFASDLWAISQNSTFLGGKSLIQSSSSFAFVNQSLFNILVQNMTLNLPLYEAFQLVQSQIGPFGSIDMRNILCPASVKQVVATGIDLFQTITTQNADAATEYMKISRLILLSHFAFPTLWLDDSQWLSFGGSILCQDFGGGTLAQGPLQYTSRFVQCDQAVSTAMKPSKFVVLIAAAVAGVNSTNLGSICVHDTKPTVCLRTYLSQSMQFIETFDPLNDVANLRQMGAMAANDVRRLKISLFQYVKPNATAPLQMLSSVFFDPSDPTFDFWSWLHVIEWATGLREAVSFQGDVGSLNVISEWTLPITQQIQRGELPTTFSTYALGGVFYITGNMLVITILIAMAILLSRGRIEGTNVFELNRVAGIVWVGRAMLFLRGITALCLLSTATLELQLQTNVSNFHVSVSPWYKTILGAGETGWIVYILHDILMVWTREYTLWYATASSILAWSIVAILTLVQPVIHHVTIDPHCQIDQMDFQVVCQSGVVFIGQLNRLYWVLAIIGVCIVVSYIYVRVAKLRVQEDENKSLLLSSGAKYLFDRTEWIHGGVYFIDPASAILNGLLTFHWRDRIHVIDIKLWRGFSIDADEGLPSRLQYSLPLRE